MPKIACPGCKKQYNVPATAAGQTATCKACGKKFRLGKAPAKPAAKQATSQPAAKAKPSTTTVPSSLAPLPKVKADDGFWDDALPEPVPTTPTPKKTASQLSTSAAGSKDPSPPKKKKKKKKKRAGWGADWAKVGGGLATFVIAGGITLGLIVTTGYLFYWPAGIALVGLFTALTGLMGEEGIW